MSLYMVQFAYITEAWTAFTKHLEDRTKAVQGLAEKVGCRFEGPSRDGRMMRFWALAVFAALWVAPLHVGAAEEFGTKAEAVAMVKRAQEMFKTDGRDATFKAISDPANTEFHDRDLYAYVYNLSGLCVAHGARPALIGKNLIDIKDQNGNYLVRAHIEIAKGPGSGWVSYKWPNPLTNKIEDKISYVERMDDDYFVGVGVYKQ